MLTTIEFTVALALLVLTVQRGSKAKPRVSSHSARRIPRVAR
jgi:hypothetical protein